MSLDNKVVDLADLKVSHDYLLGQDELLSDRINELGSGIDGIQSQITALGNGSPIPVETVAEMTDNTKAYLYTGSEQGYTSGYWYTYDSTQAKFVPRGEYGAGVIIDSTLTVTGNAADAKATGDAIKAGKTFVVQVPGSAAVLSGSITAGDFAKALAAYTAGSGVYAVKDGEVYQLSAVSSSTMTFTQMYHGTMNFIKQIQITSADTFTVTNTALSSSATDTSYSNTASGLTATNVQAAIDENAAAISNTNGRLVPLDDAVNIETEPGKNLYDNASPNIIGGFTGLVNGQSKFSASDIAAAKCLTVQLEANKTYTYAYATAAGGRHSAGLFSSIPVDQQLGDVVPNTVVTEGDYTYRKFTTGTNTVFVLYYFNRKDGIDEAVIREGIMLYEGEDIIPFEPYGDRNILKVEKDNLSSEGTAGQTLMLDEDGQTLKWGTPAVSVEIDNTLTVEGEAADAKATGDRIAQAEENMQEQLEQVVLTDGVKQWLNDHPEAMVVIKRNSDAEDAPVLGEEIMPTDGWTTNGWTGDFANGFTNTSGNTNPLSVTIPALESGALYQFGITTSNAATNGWSDFFVSLGGSDKFETYKGGGALVSYTYGLICGSTKVLTITPRNSYTGTITNLSLKKVTNTVGSQIDVYDSDGVTAYEMRTAKAAKNAVYQGENSGKYAFWGYENTAVGDNALAQNTSGFWNTAVGRRALEANQNGSRNIAIGYIALLHNTGGDRNVAVGTFALEKNTTGRGNVAINADCLQDNTTGGNNIGIGARALCGNTTGGANIGIGSNACSNNQSASGNVGIGHNALTNNTGSNNVAIGNGAGDLSGMTGSDNIIIGWGADVDAASTSHQIVIGTTRHTAVKIAGKTINFNEDGTVTWS